MKRLLTVLTATLLAACATTGTAPTAEREIKTDSDRTDSDRRASIRLELAQGYFSRGQFNTALDELKLALQAKPDMREAVNLRGLIYASMGDFPLAEETFRRALVIYPNDPDTLHNYGWFMCPPPPPPPPAALAHGRLAVRPGVGPAHLPRAVPHAAGQGGL